MYRVFECVYACVCVCLRAYACLRACVLLCVHKVTNTQSARGEVSDPPDSQSVRSVAAATHRQAASGVGAVVIDVDVAPRRDLRDKAGVRIGAAEDTESGGQEREPCNSAAREWARFKDGGTRC